LGIAVEAACPGKPLSLFDSGPVDPGADGGGWLAGGLPDQLFDLDRRHIDMHVDPVQERPGETAAIALHLERAAGAGADPITQKSACTGIHGGHQHETGREVEAGGGPGNGHRAVLEGLAQHLEHMLFELRQFVEEKDAVMGQGNFTRSRHLPAADQAGIGNCIMGRAKGSGGEQRRFFGQEAGGGENFGGLDRLL